MNPCVPSDAALPSCAVGAHWSNNARCVCISLGVCFNLPAVPDGWGGGGGSAEDNASAKHGNNPRKASENHFGSSAVTTHTNGLRAELPAHLCLEKRLVTEGGPGQMGGGAHYFTFHFNQAAHHDDHRAQSLLVTPSLGQFDPSYRIIGVQRSLPAAGPRSARLIPGDPEGLKPRHMKDKLFFNPHNGGGGAPALIHIQYGAGCCCRSWLQLS